MVHNEFVTSNDNFELDNGMLAMILPKNNYDKRQLGL